MKSFCFSRWGNGATRDSTCLWRGRGWGQKQNRCAPTGLVSSSDSYSTDSAGGSVLLRERPPRPPLLQDLPPSRHASLDFFVAQRAVLGDHGSSSSAARSNAGDRSSSPPVHARRRWQKTAPFDPLIGEFRKRVKSSLARREIRAAPPEKFAPRNALSVSLREPVPGTAVETLAHPKSVAEQWLTPRNGHAMLDLSQRCRRASICGRGNRAGRADG